MTGAALKIGEVSGQQARAAGFKEAELATRYLQVELARPVPDGGEVRIRIHKTYKDAPTYHREGDAVVFSRALTVNRDIVVLPANYEILAANLPVQVIEQADGRIAASLMNTYPGAAPLVLKARPVTARPATPAPSAATAAAGRACADGAGRRSTARNGAQPGPRQRARDPGSRDRLFPQAAGDPRVLALPRLHGVTRRGASIRERRPHGQQRVGAVRQDPGYRGSAQDPHADRRGRRPREDRHPGSRGARDRSSC